MVNYQENIYLRRGSEGRSHIPALPFWVVIIRVVQLVFAILVLILAAYSASVIGVSRYPGYGMSFFTFVWTLAFLIYILVTPLWLPRFYHYWAHLGFEFTVVVFWLTTFALLADEVRALDAAAGLFGGLFGLLASAFDPDYNASWDKIESAIKAMKAATGFGVLNWLLFTGTLVYACILVHKHRVANGETGFGGFTHRGDVEKGGAAPPVVTEQPVELRTQQAQQPVGHAA